VGGKGLTVIQHSLLGGARRHESRGGLCFWNNDQHWLGFPEENWHCRQESEKGGEWEGCVKFKHLSYLIKKNADSLSSALQTPLLQNVGPGMRRALLALPLASKPRAWLKPASVGSQHAGRPRSPALDSLLLQHSRGHSRRAEVGNNRSGKKNQQIQLEKLLPRRYRCLPCPCSQYFRIRSRLFNEEFARRCNVSGCLSPHGTGTGAAGSAGCAEPGRPAGPCTQKQLELPQ